MLLATLPPPKKKQTKGNETYSKHTFALVKIFLLIWDALLCALCEKGRLE